MCMCLVDQVHGNWDIVKPLKWIPRDQICCNRNALIVNLLLSAVYNKEKIMDLATCSYIVVGGCILSGVFILSEFVLLYILCMTCCMQN